MEVAWLCLSSPERQVMVLRTVMQTWSGESAPEWQKTQVEFVLSIFRPLLFFAFAGGCHSARDPRRT